MRWRFPGGKQTLYVQYPLFQKFFKVMIFRGSNKKRKKKIFFSIDFVATKKLWAKKRKKK